MGKKYVEMYPSPNATKSDPEEKVLTIYGEKYDEKTVLCSCNISEWQTLSFGVEPQKTAAMR